MVTSTNSFLSFLLRGSLLASLAAILSLRCDALLDIKAPTITIIQPTEGESYFGTLPVELEVTDNQGVEKVEVFLNNNLSYTFTDTPYVAELDITGFEGESITFRAVAHDLSGNWSEEKRYLSQSRGFKIISPNGGEEWSAASTYDITWINSIDLDDKDISLAYSLSEGDAWLPIASSIENRNSYRWELPKLSETKATCRVKITSASEELSDISDENFTISAMLSSLSVFPMSATLGVGTSRQFYAYGAYTRSPIIDLSSVVAWSSSNSSIARINDTGLASGHASGEAVISASLEATSQAATLIVATPGSYIVQMIKLPLAGDCYVGTFGDYVIVGMDAAYVFYCDPTTSTWDDGIVLRSARNRGYIVDMDGDYAIVGEYSGLYAANVYIYHRNGINSWDGGTSVGRSARSVCINGDYAIVGDQYAQAPYYWSGSAYIYHRTGENTWDEGFSISLPTESSYDYFGREVGIRGDYAIVASERGAYVYHRTGPNSWDNGVKLTESANNVAIDGDYAIVSTADDTYIFRRTGTNSWDSGFKIGPSVVGGPRYTGAVDISGNYAIIRGEEDEYYLGSAHVFRRIGINTWNSGTKIVGSDLPVSRAFGHSVSIGSKYAVVGAISTNYGSGGAYVFW